MHEQETETLKAEIKARAEIDIFRMYVCDALQIIEQNTAKSVGGSAHTKAYRELVDMIRNPDSIQNESAEDTIEKILDLFGEEGNEN